MKWFLKVLRHYADFSGRARRKEYWFFALFSSIFSILWALALTLLYLMIIDQEEDIRNNLVYFYPALSYSIIILIPGMAVAVRRLHDLEKSGWTLLLTLIPLVGGIWLFILMITDGDEGTNKYGPDPKTSEEILDERIQLKNIGITLISASSLLFLSIILNTYARQVYETGDKSFSLNIFTFHYITTLDFFISIMLITAGILLLNAKSFCYIKRGIRAGFMLISLPCIIYFGLCLFFGINQLRMPEVPWTFYTADFISAAFWLSCALLTSSPLFLQKENYVVRIMAILTIILSSIRLFWIICFNMKTMGNTSNVLFAFGNLLNLLSNSLLTMPFIILAGTLLKRANDSTKMPSRSNLSDKFPTI